MDAIEHYTTAIEELCKQVQVSVIHWKHFHAFTMLTLDSVTRLLDHQFSFDKHIFTL